jgi:hypothetical protein
MKRFDVRLGSLASNGPRREPLGGFHFQPIS